MKKRKMFFPALLSITLVFSPILPASVVGASVTMPLLDDHSIINSTMDGSSLASAMALNTPQGNVTPMVAAGSYHTVGLRSNGTVVVVGDNDEGQCDLYDWNLAVITPPPDTAPPTIGCFIATVAMAPQWPREYKLSVSSEMDTC